MTAFLEEEVIGGVELIEAEAGFGGGELGQHGLQGSGWSLTTETKGHRGRF